MRAWFYFYMMDTFGGVPIVTKFDQSVEAPSANTRQEVFDFIAKDLEENTEYLSNEPTIKHTAAPHREWRIPGGQIISECRGIYRQAAMGKSRILL